nr:hypothetical protein [Tanacetum cinerariifolium]
MVEKNKLDEDLHGTPVDATLYRGMIGSLMYLTSNRPDLIYAVCLCARWNINWLTSLQTLAKRKIPFLDREARIMSFITAQQTKLDLKLVPKEKRLEIRKFNRRLNPKKKQREPTFQVVLDALALTPCCSIFITTANVPEEGFTYQIENRGHKKKEKMYYPRFTKVIIHYVLTKDKTISRRNKIGMHTSRDDYLINTSRFVSANEESHNYGAQLPKSMISSEMRETKAYKTYLGYAAGVIPPKKARKFKKPASFRLATVPVSPEEPTRKSKRVKRPAKKSTNALTACVVIRYTPMMSLSKKKEKELVLKQGFPMRLKNNQLKVKLNLGEGMKMIEIMTMTQVVKEMIKRVTVEKDDEFVKTSSNSIDDEDETNVEDKAKDDEDKGIHDTTNQFGDDVDQKHVTESLEHAVMEKESSQPHITYEAAASLTEFKLKKILIDKIDKSQSYLTATEHKECYDRLIKSYDLKKSFISTYDKVYSLKRSQKDKDKDEDPFTESDRGLKKRKTSKDKEPTKGSKAKESKSGSSKGTKSQSKSSGKFVHAEEPESEVADSKMP